MRTHVSDKKLEDLEELEDMTGEPLTDGAWNALARLPKLDMIELKAWLHEALKTAIKNSTTHKWDD